MARCTAPVYGHRTASKKANSEWRIWGGDQSTMILAEYLYGYPDGLMRKENTIYN